MKVADLLEMARPAATCAKCGKGPISKTHFWYKGGWKCKSGEAAQPAAVPSAAPQPDVFRDPAPEVDHAAQDRREYARSSQIERDEAARGGRPRPASVKDVQVGDYIGFKYDIEQGATVLKITRDHYGRRQFVVRATQGEYVDNIDGTLITVPEQDAWVD